MTEYFEKCPEPSVEEGVGATLEALRCTQGFLAYLGKNQAKKQAYQLLESWVDAEVRRLESGYPPGAYEAENLCALCEREGESNPTRWLARLWRDVLGQFDEKHGDGLAKYARDHDCSGYCIPDKRQGGGAGHTTKYTLAVQQVQPAIVPSTSMLTAEHGDGGVRYIVESMIRPAWLLRGLFRHDVGLVLQGWRKALFIGYWLGVGGFALLGLLLFLHGSQQAAVSPGAWLQSLSTVAIVGLVVWLSARPLVRLVDWRITSAPTAWLAFSEEPAQMEFIRGRKDLGEANRIRFVRYSASCPVCGSKVYLREGGRQFPNRMVGRCEESPAEHVFSFDRTKQVGCYIL